MPSFQHEVLAELFRSRPTFAAELLVDRWQLALPAHDQVRLASGQLTDLSPTEYRADAVVTFHAAEADAEDRAVLAVVVEAQLSKDPDKHKAGRSTPPPCTPG